jgi:trehalose 6-phosphate synthase
MYRLVNARFADAVSQEVRTDSPLVLVQDYHFALAPRMIRKRLPLSTIVTFWHIPWPDAFDYASCPWRRELLEGLLGSSIVGFQTPDDCRNFTDAVESSLDARINASRNVITYAGHRTRVRAYPVSVEWPSRWASQWPSAPACRESVDRQLQLKPNVRLGVGIDRLDYTKGINEKFLAVERLLESHPDLRGRFTFVQIAEPSRNRLPAYRELRSRLAETSDRINLRFGAEGYRPIILLEAHHEPAEVFRFLRAADLCYVGSLHDGMNLVAKEFVAARDDNRGVLLLSKFAGAARELTDALIVDPYAIDDAARALFEALSMPDAEQSKRMRAMRTVVAAFNAYRWAGEMLMDATRLRAAATRRRHAHEPPWPSQASHAIR